MTMGSAATDAAVKTTFRPSTCFMASPEVVTALLGYEGIFRPAGGRPPHVHMQYACISILGGYEGIPQAPLGLPVHTYLAKIPNPAQVGY